MRQAMGRETGNGVGGLARVAHYLAGLEVARGCIHNLPQVANSSPTTTDVAVVPPPN